MKLWKKILFLFVAAVFLSQQLFLDKEVKLSNPRTFMSVFDERMPVIPIFVLPYYLFYVGIMVCTAGSVFFSDKDFVKVMLATYFLAALHIIIWIVYPTVMIRPETLPQSFFSGMVRHLYKVETPFNTTPSMHVSVLVFSLLVLFKYRRKWAYYTLAPNFLSIVSILFIKQHYLIDIPTGALLGFVSYYLFLREKK